MVNGECHEQRAVVRADRVIGRNLGTASVLVNLATNDIFELNHTGGRVWDLLGHTSSPRDVAVMLTAEFDLDLDSAEIEVATLVTRLESAGLVRRL
jgi:hypothetical protein